MEACFGYPAFLFARIGHPVTWIGALIAAIDRRFNRDGASPLQRRSAGILGLTLVLAIVFGISASIQAVAPAGLPGFIALALLCAALPAQRSLYTHVRAVADALDQEGLIQARTAVGMIVGRNTAVLDEAGVARATIESLAENFSDGIVAPAFWIALGGLPGGALYKAVNTADSMIGHRTPRHEAFGWAAARLDDVINLPASRLAALWLILAALFVPSASPGEAFRAVRRDAPHHRSPNAGWPEAAMAGALGLKLAGPRQYGTEIVNDVYMGHGSRDATSRHIRTALSLYRIACLIEWAVIAGLALAISGRF